MNKPLRFAADCMFWKPRTRTQHMGPGVWFHNFFHFREAPAQIKGFNDSVYMNNEHLKH